MNRHSALTLALRQLNDDGGRTPCQRDPERWTAEENPKAQRDEAARRCAPCPVLDACHDYAAAAPEPFHVWGGVDRTGRVSSGSRAETA